ncbi:MAG TPA: DUF2877 domain-containing protein [Anaerolineales bacterium]|nr:DUF2877 domain-containing protein [Anaerolineales bacterium]
MQLHAAAIGSTVPRDNFNATIQSVFDSSLNLRLAHEGRLVTILISDHYDLPQGIRLDKKIPLPYLTPSSSLMANVGLHAACRSGILRFDSSTLTIDLRCAAIWEGRIPALTPPIDKAWSIIWGTLNKEQRLKNAELVADDLFQVDQGSLLTRKLSQPVMQLITAAKRLAPRASIDAARKMIGLGPGVTPSGDDVLIGFLAGLHSTAGNEQGKLAFIQAFGESLSSLSMETSEISRTYLYHAIHGRFSSSMIALLDALNADKEKQLLSAAKAAMHVGHSSGMDSVTGLLMGLAVWSNFAPASDKVDAQPDH